MSTGSLRALTKFGGSSMEVASLYNEQFMDHVAHPDYKYPLDDPTHEHDGINPSCGDELHLAIRLGDDGRIEECAYTGHGCAVSMASADMMLDLVIGKHKDEAKRLADIFVRMIKKEASEEEIEELEEAGSLRDISHMPSRVKCAVLGWHTMEELVDKEPIQNAGEHSGEAVSTE
jgi:nitrogen fixation NifU-like protein